jgi:hypothetical protein
MYRGEASIRRLTAKLKQPTTAKLVPQLRSRARPASPKVSRFLERPPF